jgi:pimeloyl-ACP methyl ester carboxylesterase
MKYTVKISSLLILIFSGIFLKADLQESDRNWIIEFAMNPSGWHEQDSLGWMWTAPESGQSLWFYMPDYQSWNWTGLDVYPFMWSLDHDWFYYLDGSQDPHYFYSYIRNRWIDGDHLLNYPLSYRLWPGFSRDSLYETVTPFEHADAQRSHLHTADFGGSLTHPALNVVNIRTFEGIHPTPYNVVTRDEDEVFMIGGTAGEDEGSVGPYVVKFDAWTGNVVWNVQLRNMRELGEFMWPGLVTAHGNGYIYAVAGSHIWKLDSETGEVLVEASLPAPVGADSEDIAYNGFTVLPDGTLVAKCFGRPAGCEAQGTLAFTECSGEQPPSLLVAINPENLEVIDLYQMSESSGGRITSSIYSDTQYLYVPGVENIIRLTWTGSQLLLDTGWEVADYVKPGQTPASAPVVMGDWIVFQTNYSISTAPLTVWAISQADSSNRLSIDPFGIGLNGRSIIPSALSVDPENMRIFAMDAMAQKIGAIDLIDGNRLEVRWIADQMTLSHTSLVGTKDERVLAATSIVDFQPGPGGMINYNERVVWRAADTGELLAQSDLLGPMAQGAPLAPGFFGVWYYLGLDGSVTELQIETRPADLIREGFEISQFISPAEIKTWTSREITRAEFEALNPPQNWIINPVAEPDFDEGGVTRSPGASVDGDFVFEEHFGVEWMHNATTTEFNIPMDDEGLLKGNLISKHQVLTYYAGNTLSILISPDGEYYVRVIRVVDRTSEQPTLPMGWQQIENPLSDDLTIQLPNPVLAIIADNGDSFQGPFDPEALGLPSANADTDLDGLSDLWEIRYFNSIGAVTGVADSDDDGLSDLEEFTAGTNPLMADTDGDGVDDGTEIQNGTDPLVPDGATIMITDDGVQFVRTDESRFENLPDWPYDYKYVEIDGLRQAYAEAGPADGPVVLLLHGQPSWSYLYREMMPVLADAGYRVIAMDHLGCGRSDKPIDIDVYSYLGHCDRLEQFIQILGLSDINLFGQDWGSLIGLRVAGMNPEWFASIAIGNGDLIREPAGVQLFAPVENPDEILDIDSIYGFIPEQQVPFFDGCDLLYPFERGYDTFHPWAEFAMKSSNFIASEMLEALTYFPLTDEEEAAYDAPFPTRTHMAGIRVFPSLINEIPGTTDQAWEGLGAFEKPFLAIWGGNDPSTLGSCEMAEALIADIPGSTGQPHDRLPQASHFLQEDEGELIATRLVEFYAANGIVADPQTQKLGFEILEMKSLNEIVVWVNKELTEEEFNSIQLPNGWFKNQTRESDATSARFLRSPDATEDGPLFEAEHFGYTWQQNAVVVETGIQVDEQGLFEATRVAKYHELTYAAGKTVHILISPEGEYYIRIGRDANRTQEDPTIPGNWQLVEHVPVEDIVIQLPNPTFNIRADNEDSFQGPLTAEEVGLGHDPEILMTEDGVAFVRTPESRFENLPDWPYDYKYVEIDGLRQAYAEAGPADGPVVLLLHGQPSWSYLYRKMIPILAEAGYRVIAMDHLGCGRSDKPIDIDDYTYLGHNDRLEKFILGLGLTDINLFVQDWGSLIGLRVAGLNPDWFATIGVGNGALPIYPAGEEVFPPVENPNEIIDLAPFYAQIPDQQVPFYDGCERCSSRGRITATLATGWSSP